MPGILKEVIEHKLAIQPDANPVKQKLQQFVPDRKEAIKEEIERLTKASFIREVDHPEWLTNPIMVKKSNDKWRIYVDFMDLNKACPRTLFLYHEYII